MNAAAQEKLKIALRADIQDHVRSTCATGRFVVWKASPDVSRWLLEQQKAVYNERSFMESLKLHIKHPENGGREDAVGEHAVLGGKGIGRTASRSNSLDEPFVGVVQQLHQIRAVFPGFHALHTAMLDFIAVSKGLRLPQYPSSNTEKQLVRVRSCWDSVGRQTRLMMCYFLARWTVSCSLSLVECRLYYQQDPITET